MLTRVHQHELPIDQTSTQKNRCTSLVLQRVVPKWHEVTAFSPLSRIQLPPPSTITTASHHSSCLNRFRKNKQTLAKSCPVHCQQDAHQPRHQPFSTGSNVGDTAIRLLWTGPQSLQANPPRPHSLDPRGGWSFQLSLARCIRKKPLMLAAGYLVVSVGQTKITRS